MESQRHECRTENWQADQWAAAVNGAIAKIEAASRIERRQAAAVRPVAGNGAVAENESRTVNADPPRNDWRSAATQRMESRLRVDKEPPSM